MISGWANLLKIYKYGEIKYLYLFIFIIILFPFPLRFLTKLERGK